MNLTGGERGWIIEAIVLAGLNDVKNLQIDVQSNPTQGRSIRRIAQRFIVFPPTLQSNDLK